MPSKVKAVKCSQHGNIPSELPQPGVDGACRTEQRKSSPSPIVRAVGVFVGQCQLHLHLLVAPMPGHWSEVGARAPGIPAQGKGGWFGRCPSFTRESKPLPLSHSQKGTSAAPLRAMFLGTSCPTLTPGTLCLPTVEHQPNVFQQLRVEGVGSGGKQQHCATGCPLQCRLGLSPFLQRHLEGKETGEEVWGVVPHRSFPCGKASWSPQLASLQLLSVARQLATPLRCARLGLTGSGI